jgi:hypothetical protein
MGEKSTFLRKINVFRQFLVPITWKMFNISENNLYFSYGSDIFQIRGLASSSVTWSKARAREKSIVRIRFEYFQPVFGLIL